MEKMEGPEVRSESCGVKTQDIGLESLQFREEIQRLMSVPPPASDTGSSFTALLGLRPTQAMELLHSTEPEEAPRNISGGHQTWSCNPQIQIEPPKPYPIFPSNAAALIDRATQFSVFATAADISPETSSIPSNSCANSHKVKPEPIETDSNPNPSPAVSDSNPDKNPKSTKRKEREKKGKTSSKKSKNEASEEGEKLPYVHVRARRGQATDSHSLAERARREKINARMKLLQELVPGCNKISGTATVLDEIINHVQYLQRQVEFLSMRLAAVNPMIDFNLDSLFAAEIGSLTGGNFPSVVMPSVWPEGQVNGSRQQYQQLLSHFDGFHQPVWGRDFATPENSLLSYDSSANSASLHANQLKMEL